MAEFKQSQIKPGVTKHRSNAIKVYMGADCEENDILVATGMEGDFMSVVLATPDDLTKCRGPFFVADYKAASGTYTPVAIPMKTVTGVNTVGALVGDPVYLDVATAGRVVTGAIPAAVAAGAAFQLAVKVGRVTKVGSTDGAYVLRPGMADGAPLIGRVTSAATSTTVTGFTGGELAGAPVVAMHSTAAVTSANIATTVLTVVHGSAVGQTVSYIIQA
tara:strand:- start:2043 stop:2696 length:654 start_codon:yes stop_codon:yes gene_type:complete